MSPQGAAPQWRSVTADVGQRLCECVCAPALELITYWGNFFICLFCEDDPFFLFLPFFLLFQWLAVCCLSAAVQWGVFTAGRPSAR